MAIEQLQNTPAIGDIVLDPSEKFTDLDGKAKFDLLLADGSVVDEDEHPEYWGTLPEAAKLVDVSGITTSLQGIASTGLGTRWLCSDVQDKIFQIDSNYALVSSFGTVDGNPKDISYFDQHLWMAGDDGNSIRKFDVNGTQLGNYTTGGYETRPAGIMKGDDGYYYVLGILGRRMYQVTSTNLVYTGVSLTLPNEPIGGVFYNGRYWIVSQSTWDIYSYLLNGDSRLEHTLDPSLFNNATSNIRSIMVEGSEIAVANYAGALVYITGGGARNTPIIDSGLAECPYRVVADLT